MIWIDEASDISPEQWERISKMLAETTTTDREHAHRARVYAPRAMAGPHDDTTKQTFLDALARTGIVADALREAGITSYNAIYKWRREDEEFSAGYDNAVELAADALESEARRRAIEGVKRVRWDKDGNVIAEEQVYSDSLLIHLLKANKPEKFAERTKSEITNPDGSLKPETPAADAARIAAILDEARRRRDAGEDPLFS